MQVVKHVRSLISSGEVHPGDRLPPERELARKLKISRSSLRAGIGFLSAMGVLRSRHGAGTFVSSGPPARASGNPILGALMETITANLYDNRRLTVGHSRSLKESAETHREIFR